MRAIRSIWTDYTRANQLASLIRFSVSLLISMILVRVYFTIDEVGRFEYLILLSSTFSFFVGFAYTSAALSKIPKSEQSEWPRQLRQLLWQLMISAALISLFALVVIKLSVRFNWIVIEGNQEWYIVGYCFLLIVGIIPEVYYLLYRKAKSLLIWAVVYYAIQLLIVLILVFLRQPIEYIFLGYMAWQLLRFVWTLHLLKPNWYIDWLEQRKWFFFSLPLMGHFILGSGMDYLDGHLVSQFFSDSEFLFYRYGAKELPISIVLVNALSAALIPLLSQDTSQVTVLRERTIRLINLLFPVSIALLFLSPVLFSIFYGPKFIVSAVIFNIYILVLSSRILLPQVLLYAHNDNKALLRFSGIELFVNFVLSIVLMRFLGFYGIAAATVFAFLLNKILTILYIKKQYALHVGQYLPIKSYLIWVFLLLATCLLSIWMIQLDFYGSING